MSFARKVRDDKHIVHATITRILCAPTTDPGPYLIVIPPPPPIKRPLEKKIIKTSRHKNCAFPIPRTNAVRHIRYDTTRGGEGWRFVRRIVHSKVQTRPIGRRFRSFVRNRPSCRHARRTESACVDVVVRRPQILSNYTVRCNSYKYQTHSLSPLAR